MTCREICKRYKARLEGRGHYKQGHKRCTVCEVFIIWDDKYCPCCGMTLRVRPHQKKNIPFIRIK